jgi:DNA (cytosine-5)-methyltransferase 1
LLISPSGQRGRDFAIILKSLADLGYAVEWRVINAAEYGLPQRRRRVFILAYLRGTEVFEEISNSDPNVWITKNGTLAEAFPVAASNLLFPSQFKLSGDIVSISENFNKDRISGNFENAGVMINGVVSTIKTFPRYLGTTITLGDIILNEEISDDFFIKANDLEKWIRLKGAKKEMRKNADGFEYHYSEGSMNFPDPLDKPSRTIITGEGGKSPSRFKHVIKVQEKFRRLSPIELERLNMFPDNHTKLEGISDTKRAFFMGNALVVGVIEKVGMALAKKIYNELAI